jgi:hypothetical protein
MIGINGAVDPWVQVWVIQELVSAHLSLVVPLNRLLKIIEGKKACLWDVGHMEFVSAGSKMWIGGELTDCISAAILMTEYDHRNLDVLDICIFEWWTRTVVPYF